MARAKLPSMRPVSPLTTSRSPRSRGNAYRREICQSGARRSVRAAIARGGTHLCGGPRVASRLRLPALFAAPPQQAPAMPATHAAEPESDSRNALPINGPDARCEMKAIAQLLVAVARLRTRQVCLKSHFLSACGVGPDTVHLKLQFGRHLPESAL